MQSRLFETNQRPTASESRLPYLPGLDGLRALAVVAVLLYHAGLSVWGGFLGVESFFVLSGFLITALLLVEWQQFNRIDLRSFWLRRARRLLPAVLVLLVGTLLFAAVALPQEVASLRNSTFAALAYVMNWYLVGTQQSYFDPSLRPPLLQHLWSLAVEEQFYLVWPLLFMIGIRFLRRSGLLLVIIGGAIASFAWMAHLYEPGADPSRIYYGTDTRAGGLLVGAALAMIWTPGRVPAATNRTVGRLLDVVGGVALVGLLYAYFRLFEFDPRLYTGGFALVSVMTAIVIAAVAHPTARLLPAILGVQPLRWLGMRSYSIYLWHWPVFQVTRPYLDVPFDGWQLLALRLLIVLALAELSYRLVEMPVRRGALGRTWEKVRAARPRPAATASEQPVLQPALVPVRVLPRPGQLLRRIRDTHDQAA